MNWEWEWKEVMFGQDEDDDGGIAFTEIEAVRDKMMHNNTYTTHQTGADYYVVLEVGREGWQ